MKIGTPSPSRTPRTDTELYARLALDPYFFIETFFNIVDKNRAQVPFLFNAPQKKYNSRNPRPYRLLPNGDVALRAAIFDLILKARKQGFSSDVEAVWLHACLFVKNARCVVMSHEKEATKRHLDRVRYYLDHLGDEDEHRYSIDLEDDSQMQLSFPDSNSTYWIGTAGAKAFGRGDDITHLHISELAWYEHQEVVTGVLEACVPFAWRVCETTGNGLELFYRLWQAATGGNWPVSPQAQAQIDSPWSPFFCGWHEDPSYADPPKPTGEPPFSKDEQKLANKFLLSDHQLFWRRHKISSMVDPALFPQEYPAEPRDAFLSGGQCVFDADGLAAQETKVEPPSWRGILVDKGDRADLELDPNGPVLVYRRPDHHSKYLIFADPSYGKTSGDWSPAGVFRRGTRELVALLWAKLDPSSLGQALYGLGMFYNWAKVAVEVFPGPGIATVNKLLDLRYPSLYRRHVWKLDKYEPTEDLGWWTDERSRQDMLSAGKNAIRTKDVLLRSREVLDQFYNFVRHEGGREEARSGTHDDCVMMVCGALRCMEFDPVGELLDESTRPRERMIHVTGGSPPPPSSPRSASRLLASRRFSNASPL